MCCLKHFIIGEGDYIMGVGSVASMNSMSNVQMTMARSADVKSKRIQNEITGIQQQMQKISSKEELSVDEKANERKKQQKEISSLNTELKRHQEELLKSQKREIMMAELQKNEKPAEEVKSGDKIQTDETNKKGIAEKEIKTIDSDMDSSLSQEGTSAVASVGSSTPQADYREAVIFKNNDGIVILKGEINQDEKRSVDADKKQTDKTKEESIAEREIKIIDNDTGLSHKEIHAIISADASAQQTSLQGTVIARIRDGIAVLKGEIKQDERRGVDTDKKQKELEKLEKKEEKARTFPFSVLREENSTMRSATKAKVSGTQIKTDNNALINVSKLSKEDAQASQQRFYVSLGNGGG